MSPHHKRKTAAVVDSDAIMIGVAYRRGLIAHVEAGRMLAAKKASLKHGQWLPWLAKNKDALGFGELAAQRLMKLAVENPSLGDAFAADGIEARELTAQLWGHKYRDAQQDRFLRVEGNDQCFTPVPIVRLVRKVLGTIDLDPATCAEAQARIRAKKFFTADDDALTREWRGRVFLNPPFSKGLIMPFVDKFLTEWEAGRVTEAIVLTMNKTETLWGQALGSKADAICFVRRAMAFDPPAGREWRQPGYWGHNLSFFGKDTEKFARVFSEHGFIR